MKREGKGEKNAQDGPKACANKKGKRVCPFVGMVSKEGSNHKTPEKRGKGNTSVSSRGQDFASCSKGRRVDDIAGEIGLVERREGKKDSPEVQWGKEKKNVVPPPAGKKRSITSRGLEEVALKARGRAPPDSKTEEKEERLRGLTSTKRRRDVGVRKTLHPLGAAHQGEGSKRRVRRIAGF